MTTLTAVLLFGTAIVVGVTCVALAALNYVKYLDTPDPNENRCPALNTWTGSSPNNKGIKYPYRCTLADGHEGPHHIAHPMPGNNSDRDYWWNGAEKTVKPIESAPSKG